LTYAGIALGVGAGAVVGYATCPSLLGSQLPGWECIGQVADSVADAWGRVV